MGRERFTSKEVPDREPIVSQDVISTRDAAIPPPGYGHRGKSEMNDKIRQPPDTSMTENTKRKKGRLSADIQYKLGQQLRAMYTDVVNEGVPDQFSELIQRLDKRDEK